MWPAQLFLGLEKRSLGKGPLGLPPQAGPDPRRLADGRAFDLEPRAPPGPLGSCCPWFQGIPLCPWGQLGLHQMTTQKAVTPDTGGWAHREARTKPKAKTGPSRLEAAEAPSGHLFRPPPRSGGLGTLGGRGQFTQVSALWTWSLGGRRKTNDATPTAPSPWGPGARSPSPWFLCRLCSQGWLGLYTEAALGIPAMDPRQGCHELGRNGGGGTRMCETCTFSKEDEEGRLGSGLALEGRADTHLLDLGYGSLLPTRKAGNLGKEGGSCWVPTKAREA